MVVGDHYHMRNCTKGLYSAFGRLRTIDLIGSMVRPT